jgi:hypothetical protein
MIILTTIFATYISGKNNVFRNHFTESITQKIKMKDET